jgi:hypothetical protein
MKEAFDENDILRFIYDELEPLEHEAFVEALMEDEDLFNRYEELKEAHSSLASTSLEAPSDISVHRVMSFARKSVRERPGAAFLLTHGKSKMVGFNHLVSVLMVFFTVGTIAVAMLTYDKVVREEAPQATMSLDWDDTQLNQKINFARFNLNNIRGNNREAVLPVYHDTYRVVKTSNFTNLGSPGRNVEFIHIK